MRRNEMKSSVLWACALVFLAAGAARGQQPDQDPIGQSFFAPELVMQHQEAIGLNEGQWKLQDEMEKLVSLVKQPHVEEQEALAQLEKVLAIEREIKRAQVTLMVRIKNKLTPEQQAKLVEIRGKPGSK